MVMGERTNRDDLRDRRMNEPGAAEAYDAAKLAFELGASVRVLQRLAQALDATLTIQVTPHTHVA